MNNIGESVYIYVYLIIFYKVLLYISKTDKVDKNNNILYQYKMDRHIENLNRKERDKMIDYNTSDTVKDDSNQFLDKTYQEILFVEELLKSRTEEVLNEYDCLI